MGKVDLQYLYKIVSSQQFCGVEFIMKRLFNVLLNRQRVDCKSQCSDSELLMLLICRFLLKPSPMNSSLEVIESMQAVTITIESSQSVSPTPLQSISCSPLPLPSPSSSPLPCPSVKSASPSSPLLTASRCIRKAETDGIKIPMTNVQPISHWSRNGKGIE